VFYKKEKWRKGPAEKRWGLRGTALLRQTGTSGGKVVEGGLGEIENHKKRRKNLDGSNGFQKSPGMWVITRRVGGGPRVTGKKRGGQRGKP